jgi:general secretion pathway protein E
MHCRQAYQPLPEVVEEKGLSRFQVDNKLTLYQAEGCKEGGDIGYSGRMAIIEFLVMNDSLRKMVMEHKESGLIQEQAVKDGMLTLYDDGLAKAAKGLTTLDEVLRVTTEG